MALIASNIQSVWSCQTETAHFLTNSDTVDISKPSSDPSKEDNASIQVTTGLTSLNRMYQQMLVARLA
jgi:hypothetical protein